MTNKSMMSLIGILFAFAATLFAPVCANAADNGETPFDLSLEDNINLPNIPAKKINFVKEEVSRLRQHFDKAGFATGRIRQGTALLVTIPCSDLFNSNSTQLSERGKNILRNFDLLEDVCDKYKMLIAVHTDDTGEIGYAESITAERANAINDFLDHDSSIKDMIIIPYGLGRDEPLGPNDSIKNRGRNRRAEIYIIPLQSLFSKK